MAEAPEPAAVAAAVERRIVSVLFADLVGFTTLSEQLDAEDVATVQDAYFGATRETIRRYGGVLEKFIGDAAMAVFGTPRARDDDAERAVRAGLALIGALEQLETGLGMQPQTLQLRVGVNTGEVVHATSGPDEGRVTGDTVNTAARLQAAARPGTVLIGELTALTVAEMIETQPMGAIELKGKAEPVRTWEATGARSQPSREEALGALKAPMLGRDVELARLHAAIEAISTGRGADRIVIVAPPGVGKSRLLAELAATTDAIVLRARVRPQATAPYETVAQLLGAADTGNLAGALADAGVSEARATVIRHEVTRLTEPSSGPPGGGGDLAAERDARFGAWVTALDALGNGPSVWLIEDVHWAGGDLLAFLDHAGGAGSRHGRLVVATARPSLLETAPQWCEGARIDLAPLPPSEASALVRALLGTALPDELLAAVVERSDGTPLFIEELLRTWASVGTLALADGAWQLAIQPDSVSLPPTVQAIYAAQLDDLPPDARQVARRGSVAGRRVPLAAFPSLELGDRRPGLDVLRRRAFVAGPFDDPITGDSYAYRHALLRDAGYASLARAERARLHVAMARWLADTAGDRADLVAEAVAEHHAAALESLPSLASGDLPDRVSLMRQAAAWYERAAEAALRLAAPAAAQRLFARSIELTDTNGAPDLARRRLRLGEILADSADLDAGIGEMEAALEGFTGDAAGTAAAAYALARAYMQQIRFREAEQLTAATLARLANQPGASLARLQALHAWTVGAQGRTDGVRAETDLAWADARATGDAILELDVLEHVNAARDEIGEAGLTDWALLEEKALAIGRWHQVVVAGRIRAVLLSDVDFRSALPRLAAVAELASAHGLTEQAGWVNYSRAETLWVVGDWEEALEVGGGVIELGERYAYQRLTFRTWVILLPIAALRRDAALAEHWERWWTATVDHFPSTPSPYARVVHAAIAVWVAQATGRPVDLPAEDLIDSMIPMSNPHFLAAVETIVRAWLDAGRTDLATLAAQRSAANATDPEATGLMRASAALLDAWARDSAHSARTAVNVAGELGARWWELRALRALGDPRADAVEGAIGIS
ncbi:MAG TPA: adenylate/guanylate cyclase domain-containing protein [Candidatus Limnocylindrales bacterium]|nr:adenylate/guanylate cyclase domain-containing protein [Candidatus Limnocylindrales bacterium]